MAVPFRNWIVGISVACASVAAAAPKRPTPAAPKASAAAQYKVAAEQYSNGSYAKALELIEQGLAIAPKDLELLGLEGSVLLELRDYPAALAAYQAYLEAGPTGGAAIAAAALWLTGAPESRVAVTPRLGTVAGLDLAVRF